jgi:hypothetical protein
MRCGDIIEQCCNELFKGMTIEEAKKLTISASVAQLGGLPDEKIHCSVMLEEAVKAALEDYIRELIRFIFINKKAGNIVPCFYAANYFHFAEQCCSIFRCSFINISAYLFRISCRRS